MMTRAAKAKQNEEPLVIGSPAAEVSSESTNTNTLLRNNLLKLKQKVMDTSKLLDLYSSVKAELDASQKKIRSQALDAKNLQFQIDRLIQERDPLLKAIHDKTEENTLLLKEAGQYKISYQSQSSFCVQLKAELEDMRKARVKRAQKQEKDALELDKAKKSNKDLEQRLNKAISQNSRLQSDLTREKDKTKSLTSTLSELLPILKPLSGHHIEHRWVNIIETALGKKLSNSSSRSMANISRIKTSPVDVDEDSAITHSVESDEDSDSESMDSLEEFIHNEVVAQDFDTSFEGDDFIPELPADFIPEQNSPAPVDSPAPIDSPVASFVPTTPPSTSLALATSPPSSPGTSTPTFRVTSPTTSIITSLAPSSCVSDKRNSTSRPLPADFSTSAPAGKRKSAAPVTSLVTPLETPPVTVIPDPTPKRICGTPSPVTTGIVPVRKRNIGASANVTPPTVRNATHTGNKKPLAPDSSIVTSAPAVCDTRSHTNTKNAAKSTNQKDFTSTSVGISSHIANGSKTKTTRITRITKETAENQETAAAVHSSGAPEMFLAPEVPVPQKTSQITSRILTTKRKRIEIGNQCENEIPPRKKRKTDNNNPIEASEDLETIFHPDTIHEGAEEPREFQISSNFDSPPSSPMEEAEYCSYSIDMLMSSVETYSKHMETLVRWPKEEERSFIQRRLDILLKSLKKASIEPVQYQKLLLAATYDFTCKENKISLQNLISPLLSAYSKLHQLILRKYSKKESSYYIENMLAGLEASKSVNHNKIKMLNDFVWNLHLLESKSSSSSLYRNGNLNFLDNVMIQMVGSVCKLPLHSDENSLLFRQRVLLCKRATEFAKALGDVYFVRNLVYHVIYLFPVKFCLFFVASIVSVWSQPLEKPQETSGHLFLLVRCLLKEAALENEISTILYDSISNKCKWEATEDCIEELLESCVKNLASCVNHEEDMIYDIKNVLELLCRLKGWAWTYNYLICKKLALLMVPTSSEGTLAGVVLLLGALCRAAMAIEGNTKLSGTAQLRARILSLLQPSSPVSLYVQEKAVLSLFDLSAGILSNLQGILPWFRALPPTKQETLCPSIHNNIKALEAEMNF